MVKTKLEILTRDNFLCQKCGQSGYGNTLQLAHRVKQGSGTIKTIQNLIHKTYGADISKAKAKEIMHDELNLVTSCASCNDSFNIYFKTVQMEKLIIKIYRNILDNK